MRKTTTTTYKYDENGKLVEMTVRVEEDANYNYYWHPCWPQPSFPYQVYSGGTLYTSSGGSSDITYKTYN